MFANASRRVWGKSTFCLQIGRDVPHHDDRYGIHRRSSPAATMMSPHS
jgi:hypothetical protein